MYQYTSNSMPSFNKGSVHSLPDTYYPSSQQQPQYQQSYGWYPQHQQQHMAASSVPVLSQSSIIPPPAQQQQQQHLPTTAANPPPPSPSPFRLNNHHHHPSQRPKITTSLWEDEGTICYQVDARGICVARRQDNDMINGTKLLNVTGMSRGKRDGILKNEKGRVVVKVGAMHLKGVWVTFSRAKALAIQHNIKDVLEPLFMDDPSIYFYSNPMAPPHANYFIPTNHHQQHRPTTSSFPPPPPPPMEEMVYSAHRHTQPQPPSSTSSSSSATNIIEPTRAVVPSMGGNHLDYYAYRNNSSHLSTNTDHSSSISSSSSTPPSLQDLHSSSTDQLDQHSLLDYASKASSSIFSLPSPGTPSQPSLFYNEVAALDQYYQQQQQQQKSRQQPPLSNPNSMLMDVDPTMYYTHPCASTASFHDPSLFTATTTINNNNKQDHHQATLEFYGAYHTPSSQQQQQYSAQPW